VRRILLLLALACGCGPSLVWTGRTPDRLHAVTVTRTSGLDFVAVDGQRRAAYRGIAGWSIALARHHIAFAARVDGRWVIVRDGHVEPERWDGIGALQFTDTGTLVCLVERAGGWHVVTNGVVGPRHDAILAGTLRTSGSHVAYVAQQANRSRVIVDAVPQELFDGISQLVLRPDGRTAYVARRGLDMHAVIDGHVGPARERVSMVELGPRGRSAYAASFGDEARIVIDGELGPAVDSIRLIRFSDDGTRVAWLGRLGTLDVLALDDKPVAAWPSRREPKFAFRPGTSSLAYVASTPNGERVIVDNVAGPIFDEVRTPVWGPNGVVYAALRAGKWIIVDGGRELDAGDAVGDPVVTSTRLAYGGRRGKSAYVAVDGKTFTFDLVFADTIAFSRDGRRWAAVVGDRTRERLYIVVDGRQRVPVDVHELYSSVASGKDDALVAWTRAELER